eukprot:1087608-Prorocentrum_minimum.AAC.1
MMTLTPAHTLTSQVTYGALLRTCEGAGLWEEAAAHFEEMRGAGLAPNALTFNALLATMAAAGQVERAERVCADMEAAGVERTAATYVHLINAFATRGKWEQVGVTHLSKLDCMGKVSKLDCMGKPTVARWLGAVGKFVSRRGEAGFWWRALCPRVLHPKRGKAKDL